MVAYASEITAESFPKDVVERSQTTPVLLDFWASWCEPCQTLGPVLTALAEEYGGAFHLGKVDTETQQDLAYAFGVQGIPFCVLVKDGRPVDGFQGALPEAEIRQFLTRHGVESQAAPDDAAPAIDPDGPEARLARARQAAAAGDAAAVRAELADFPEDEEQEFDAAQRLLTGVEWLQATLAESAGPAEARLAAARQHFLGGDHAAAMTTILEAVAEDKDCRDGLARKAMLLCFAVVGEEDEQLDDYRRRLATLLY